MAMKIIHCCCTGASQHEYRVLAVRERLEDAQEFMRAEAAANEDPLPSVAPAPKYSWVPAFRKTKPLVGFIATWALGLDRSEVVHLDFSPESGCWDNRSTRPVPPKRPRDIY